jgi:hypothetical protein
MVTTNQPFDLKFKGAMIQLPIRIINLWELVIVFPCLVFSINGSVMYDTWGERLIVGSQVSTNIFFVIFNLTKGNPIKPTHLATTKMSNQYRIIDLIWNLI